MNNSQLAPNNSMSNPLSKPTRKTLTSARIFCYLVFGVLFLATRWGTIGKLMLYNEKKEKYAMHFAATRIDFAIMGELLMGFPIWKPRDDGYFNPFLILLPIPITDLNFSLMTDIIMLPLDQYYYSTSKNIKAQKDEKYWIEVFKTGQIQRNKARRHIKNLYKLDDSYFENPHNLPPFDVILDLSIAENSFAHFYKLAQIPNLHKEQYWRLYNATSTLTNLNVSVIYANLAQNSATPKEIILDMKKNNLIPVRQEKQPEE